jgi:quercetin dioxygenase-like cupin family protein
MTEIPQVFRILQKEALERPRSSPTGEVGRLFSSAGMEAVWVSKQDEDVDPEWFSQPMVDLILVVQGQLRVEFERPDLPVRVLDPGDLLVLPPNMRCRAYRWPRERREATVFLAVYPHV